MSYPVTVNLKKQQKKTLKKTTILCYMPAMHIPNTKPYPCAQKSIKWNEYINKF